jgi:putative transposase
MTQLINQVVNEAQPGARAFKSLSAAVGVSRATYYRHRQQTAAPAAPPAEQQRRQAIQALALTMPSAGHRPLTMALKRCGLYTGRDRVLRYMREADLLCRRRRRFIVTTNSRHSLRVFPNLARDLIVTTVDQLWVADITYIPVGRRFVYLAVLLDAFSRRVIGWALERHLLTALPLTALRMALASRTVKTGLVHHSDQGSQYAATEYVSLLQQHRICGSMSRTANPYDNALAERFIRTLKYEEVYRADYQTLTEARASLKHFIEQVYNRERLHSALGYRPPVEFEQLFSQPISP